MGGCGTDGCEDLGRGLLEREQCSWGLNLSQLNKQGPGGGEGSGIAPSQKGKQRRGQFHTICVSSPGSKYQGPRGERGELINSQRHPGLSGTGAFRKAGSQ